jgi:hypothetical protein
LQNSEDRFFLFDVHENPPDRREGVLGHGLTQHLYLSSGLRIHTGKFLGGAIGLAGSGSIVDLSLEQTAQYSILLQELPFQC